MTKNGRKEVKELLASFKEALESWLITINDPIKIKEIKSASVDNPIEELTKLVSLIKAHTTKIGIIFKPETFQKQFDAAYNTVSKASESIILLISIIPQLNPETLSIIFHDEIILKISEIFQSNLELVSQLQIIEQETLEEESEEVARDINTRLMSVGKVWSSCDNLTKVLKDGKLGLLNTKFKQSIMLIEDGLDEFEEWVEDPEVSEDPFGFEDEDEDEDEQPEELDEETKAQLTAFGTKILNKFKLIKLLFSSISKSLPSITSGKTINELFENQKQIVNLVDKLIVELMMNAKISHITDDLITSINKNCNNLLKIVKAVNKSNENKVKWCEAWESKFSQ